jgi:hypothetical protein
MSSTLRKQVPALASAACSVREPLITNHCIRVEIGGADIFVGQCFSPARMSDPPLDWVSVK